MVSQQSNAFRDEHALLWMILGAGLLPIVFVLVRGGVWGAEPTVGLLMTLFGVKNLGSAYREGQRRRFVGPGKAGSEA